MEQNPSACSCPAKQTGKWYAITFGWRQTSYYARGVKHSTSTEVVFISEGDSIAKHILLRYKYFRENGNIYSREERGLEDANWQYASIVELALLLSDGQKIVGFKPKSIADLFLEGGWEEWERLIEQQDC